MIKAIKTLAIISAFALIVSSLSACSLSFSKTESPTTTETTTTEVQTEPTEVQTTTESETQSTTAAPQENVDTINDIFDGINSFEIGTAGSSAKAANLALRLIAFSNSDIAQSESLVDEVQKLVDTVTDEDVYAEALYQVNSYAKKFFKGNQSDVIEIAGRDDFPLDKEYSQEKYQKIYNMLQK